MPPDFPRLMPDTPDAPTRVTLEAQHAVSRVTAGHQIADRMVAY